MVENFLSKKKKNFCQKLIGKWVYGDVEDVVWLAKTKNGIFSVKCLYNNVIEQGKCFSFPYKDIR